MLGFKKRPQTDWIIVHCSKTKPDQKDKYGQPCGYRYLKEKHPIFDIGYHWLIDRQGVAIQCRNEDVPGNHCPGYNQTSVAVCMIGGLGENGEPESNYTSDQWRCLEQLVGALLRKYPKAKLASHYDRSGREGEWCPAFNARDWWAHIKLRERQREAQQTKPEGCDPQTPEVNRSEH